MNAYSIGILISIIIYVFVGNYAGRKVKHLEDYFVAGRNAPTLLIVGTLVASVLSTASFLGSTGMAYNGYAVLLLLANTITVIGYVIGALYFGRFLRRSKAITVADFFGQRFDSHRVRVVAGITIIVAIGAYLIAVTQGAALILSQITAIPYGGALCIVWASYTMFTFYAGSRGVIITDTIMFLLFTVVAFVALAFIINAAGGWSATISNLVGFEAKPGIVSWHGLTGPDANWHSGTDALVWAVIYGLSWALVLAVSPWQVSRYLMAKSEQTVMRSACTAGGVLLILWIALMFSGAAVNLSNPDIDIPDNTMIWAALNLMSTLAGALLLSGIMAAALSSASTFLSLVGFSASHDIVRHKSHDDQRLLRLSRYTMLYIGLAALALAYATPTNIFWLSFFAGTVFASSWGPIAFLSIWSSRVTADAAFWGIVVGFVGNVVPKFLTVMGVIELPVYLDPLVIGGVLSLIVIVWVSRQGEPSSNEKNYRSRLHQVPQAELDPTELSKTLLWPKALILLGVVVSAVLIIFYVRPYAAAAESLGIDSSGELWLSIAYGSIFSAIGILAYYGIKKAYGTDEAR
jgi:sodium/pantothenate symporter